VASAFPLLHSSYRNVYELHELVNVNDPRIAFEGSLMEQKPTPLAPTPAK
jgi:hypothetical protein